MDDKKISWKSEATFLGIIFDSKLTWKKHIDKIVDRCKKRLNIMRCLTGQSWGCGKETLMLFYRCAIRSVMEFGCEAFDSASESQKQRLEKIQYSALKTACGAMVGTSLAALQIECGDPPLDIRRKMLITNLATKTKIIPNHPTKDVFVPPRGQEGVKWRWFFHRKVKEAEHPAAKRTAALNKIVDKFNPVPLTPSLTPPWKLIPPLFNEGLVGLKKDDPSIVQRAKELIATYTDSRHMYTDASKIDNVAAVGIYIPEKDMKIAKRVTNDVSIYTAELTAIKCGLEWMAQPDGPHKIALFTDSYSSMISLKNSANAQKSALVESVLTLASNLSKEGKTITLIWVPSHVGIRGNEMADCLAKEATKHPEIEIEIMPEIFDIKRTIRRELLNEWQTRWDSAQESRHYWSLEKKVSNKIKFKTTNRKKEVIISRLRLGKCRLKQNLKRMNLHETGLCETCGTEETIEHWLLHCKETTQLGMELGNFCKRIQKPTTLQTILNSEICHDIIYKWIQNNPKKL